MEQILLAYGLPKETVTTKMMLNINMKVKVCSPDTRNLLQTKGKKKKRNKRTSRNIQQILRYLNTQEFAGNEKKNKEPIREEKRKEMKEKKKTEKIGTFSKYFDS